MRAPRLDPMGDGAVRWRRDPTRDARKLLEALRAYPGVIDAVVTEEHALVTFAPSRPIEAPWEIEAAVPRESASTGVREHVVRARYDGPDLDAIAADAKTDRAAIVTLHASRTYVVRLVGFLPGFAYLGPVAPELSVPRRATPRPRVDAGTIGVAGGYTGIYPLAAPGGWHLIGRAIDCVTFDPETGARFGLGDRVRFEATP